MSQTNTPTIYAGIDVAKDTLEFRLSGTCGTLKNQPVGHAQLLKMLRKCDGTVQVILEASGGYHAPVMRVLHQAGVALSVVQPRRVRAYAEAMGIAAKTDRIDAGLLVAFGQGIKPPATPAPSERQLRIQELATRRAQLIETRTAELNRSAHYTDKGVQRQSQRLLALLDRQIADCQERIAALIAAEPLLQDRYERLQQVPGVGPQTAASLLAYMPELGHIDDAKAAALAGVAPYNDDSGPQIGRRRIRGGRSQVRCAIYMATLSAVRHDRILREFYQRLRNAGKPPMVALTAAMRKLIVLLNRLLRNPAFTLAA